MPYFSELTLHRHSLWYSSCGRWHNLQWAGILNGMLPWNILPRPVSLHSHKLKSEVRFLFWSPQQLPMNRNIHEVIHFSRMKEMIGILRLTETWRLMSFSSMDTSVGEGGESFDCTRPFRSSVGESPGGAVCWINCQWCHLSGGMRYSRQRFSN